MPASILKDAFAHHLWATVRLLDACLVLSPEQLAAPTPGTYGSVLETYRHLVGADSRYLFALAQGQVQPVATRDMSLPELRGVMQANGAAWSELLAGDLDPDEVIVSRRRDGSRTEAPVGIRLAQALHHGSDHRSQICTTLTLSGVEPPGIDLWDFAHQDGRLVEVPPAP